MQPEERRSGPRQARPDTTTRTSSLSDPAAVERARRRWRLHRIGARRKISVALDTACGIELPPIGAVQIDYEATGLTLGWTERVAAGRAGLGLAA